MNASYEPRVILGAGAAGLSAAYFLRQHGQRALVLEKNAYYGGLARSFRWNGFWCDFSAHRFFTNNADVLAIVQALLPMHAHDRRSQIFLHQTWMRDPIDVVELLTHLPPAAGLGMTFSYLARDQELEDASFEHYVLKRYGRAFYEGFFRHYTERLFSLPGHRIAVEWAQRKVRLASPVDRLRPATKTKFSQFYYPVQGGYGAIVNRLYEEVQDQVHLNARVTSLEQGADGRIVAVCYEHDGQACRIETDQVISTLPLTLNARLLGAQLDLEYQKVDAVYLLLNKPQMSNNHWLYFMDQASAINRIVEFKHMSAVDTRPDQTVVCAEVTREISDPVGAVVQNLVHSGLIDAADVLDSHVVREPFAYPRYTCGYPAQVRAFETSLQAHPNFLLLGRAAQFEHDEVDDLIEKAYNLAAALVKPAPSLAVAATPDATHAWVWIVVLTLNNYQDTAECLASLQQLQYPAIRIVLVDNGSTDGTPAHVREQFPAVEVIENGRNLGVPAGYNVGFRHALSQGADYIFMINNDTIVDPAMIDHLMQAAHEPHAGVLAPIVYYHAEPQAVWSAGARYRAVPPAIVMETRVHHGRYHELQYAISCGLLITRATFEQAGLFDENFLFLWDDLDFSERVRSTGLRILQVPRAHMWHKVSRTTNPASPLFWQTHGESGAIFYRRHGRPFALAALIHLGYFAVREFAIKWRWQFLAPFLKGLGSGLTRSLRDVPQVKDNIAYPR